MYIFRAIIRAMFDLRKAVQHPDLEPIDGPHREFAIRFRMAVQFAGLKGYDADRRVKFGSYAKVAEKLPYKRQMVGNLYRGLQKPDDDKYRQIAKATKVSYTWLRDGTGDMVAGDDYNDIINKAPENVRRSIEALLEPYRGK